MDNEKDVSGLIENLEAFEDRLGVRFEALSAWCAMSVGDHKVHVGGELHLQDGNFIDQAIEIVADVYNDSGHLIGTDKSCTVSPISFFGYATFMICVDKLPSAKLKRIRVYPKPATY